MDETIDRHMKLHDLRVFVTVVQAGGMGKAARQLHTSQPAISRSIAGLEGAFGVRLLERTAHGVAATEHGRALLEGGAAVFDELRQAARRIAELSDPTAGEIRLGSTAFTAASFVSAVVDRFSRRHPKATFRIVTAAWDGLHRELHERRVDLLVTRSFEGASGERFSFEPLFEETFVVAAGIESPWARRRKIALGDLANESWVLPPEESAVSSIAARAFAASGVDYPRAAVVTLTPEVRLSLVATGRFLSVFPASMVRFSPRRAEIKVLPVEFRTGRVPTGIVTLRERRLSPVTMRFVETARDVAKEVR